MNAEPRAWATTEEERVERFNQVHDVKNVFVTDGASFVTQGCYEPTLTIMAISARAADYIAEEYSAAICEED